MSTLIVAQDKKIIKKREYFSTNFSRIVLPNGLEEIRTLAFAYNDNLEELYLPDSVKKIDVTAFLDCNNIKKVFIGKRKAFPAFKSMFPRNTVFVKNEQMIVKKPVKKPTTREL